MRKDHPKRTCHPAMQIQKMKAIFPQFNWTGRGGEYLFSGILQPTIISQVYSIIITYRLNCIPKVYVLKPELKKGAPHLYPDRSLCLYYPRDLVWTNEHFIAEYTLPWAAAWLYFYESWLKLGVWLGPEAPHNVIT